jgi:cytochrome P450
MEALYLSIAVLAGSYSAWFFAERLWLHSTGAHLTPYAPADSPWLAVAAVSMCLYAWHQHYWLRRMRIHNTKPAAVYPHWDRILGIDMLLVVLKALKENRLVEHWDGLFRTLGPTHWQLVTGQWMLFTNDPVILKAILSTQFEDWPIGGLRQKTTLLTLGPHAIFSVNGKEWQQGRALIRPTFVRNQIADLECQDRHVERLLEKIPGGGETIDLQKLLYLFTMDTATDFM